MFTNSAYYSVFTGSDQYRTINVEDTLAIRIIKVYVLQFNKILFVNNLLLLITLTVIVIMMIIINIKSNIKVNLSTAIIFIISILFITFNRTALLNPNVAKPLLITSSLLFTVLIISFTVFIITNFKKTKVLNRILFYLISSFLLIAPFFLITPFSARCTFASYIFIILIIIEIAKYISNHLSFDYLLHDTSIVSIFIILLLSITYLSPLSINRFVDYQRLNEIQNLKHYPKVITMNKVPFTDYNYNINLNEKSFMTPFFKEVYDIPKETKIHTKVK